jgi:hypothetical protein
MIDDDDGCVLFHIDRLLLTFAFCMYLYIYKIGVGWVNWEEGDYSLRTSFEVCTCLKA